MGDKRVSTIERIVHRIEEHIEEWRERDKALKGEAEANRDALWAEAAERERLLAEA
jgi:C4-type Zn-finger protein